MSETKFIDLMKMIQERMKLPKTYLGKTLTSEELLTLSTLSMSIHDTIDPDSIVDALKGFEKKKIPFDNIPYIGYAISFGFDRTVYENPALSKDQLIYILYGDLLGVDVSIYANEKFTSFQMLELLSGLVSGIDVRSYADPAFSVSQMREIQNAIEDGFEIMDYVGVDSYAEEIHTIHSLLKIGRDKNIDVVKYLDMPFNWRQLREIKEGLLDDLDVSIYADPKYSEAQMEALYDGLNAGVDVSIYADPKFDASTMNTICALLSRYHYLSIPSSKEFSMEEIVEWVDCKVFFNVDIRDYLGKGFDHYQLFMIGKGLSKGLDVSIYADPKFTGEQMNSILDGLREGIDVSVYANPKYSYRKMDLIKLFLINNIPVDFDKIPDNLRKDILRYMIKFIRYGVNPEKYLSYKIGQLFEITKGIKEGLDISQFDDISLDKDQMRKIRQKLYNEKMSKHQAI